MKIFNAMFSKVNGGLEQVFLKYTHALESQGNEVFPVIHPNAEIRALCPTERLITVHNFNQHDLFAVRRLKKYIQQHKPDCIVTHSYRAAYLFKKTKTSVPKIAVCHVKGHYDFGADAIIALTESMRRDIIDFGIPEDRVFTVPNFIEIRAQNPSLREDHETITIGVCARFAPIKGVDVFIHALRALKNKGIPFKALIAGDGPQKDTYLELIKALDLSQEVCLLGWINDRDAFYRQLDIFCLPSREESFGLVILESMLHGLPMVLSALSGPLDIVGSSQCALMVPPENPAAMANAIETIITQRELAKTLSHNATQRVQAFSVEKVSLRLQKVLEEVVERANRCVAN